MSATGSRWRGWLLGTALFLIVWGGKLVVVERWGSDLPESDDWGAIGQDAIIPWAQGRFDLAHVFAAHNEHRVAVTRVLNLALVIANGQWDARLECLVSGALHALMAAGVWLLGRTVLPRTMQAAWFVVLVLLTGPPVVWENIVRGFDSQHYLLIGFSVATIAAWMTSTPWSRRWWGGSVCAVLALFTMGSGLVAAAVVAATLALTLTPRDLWRRQRWTLAAAIIVVVAGWLLRVEVPGHAAMQAHTFGEFWTAFYHHLQWPLVHHPLFGVISFLPWAWRTGRCIWSRDTVRPVDRITIAIGLWALVHYAAMAYVRGSLQPWPPVRGLDNVVVGLAVNAFILLEAAGRVRWTEKRVWPGIAAGCVWGGACVCGVLAIVHENVTTVLPARRARVQLSEDTTRAYLATGDPAWLRPGEIPYPDPGGLRRVLDQPEIRAVLPASVRPAIAIAGTSEPAGAFHADDQPTTSPDPPGLLAVRSTAEGTGTWRSAPVTRKEAPYWQFRVQATGSRDTDDLTMRSSGGQLLARLGPGFRDDRGWSEVVVRVPEIPAVLVAQDRREDGAVAFSGPVEVAAGSVLARALTRRGWWLVGLGGVLVLSVLIAGRSGLARPTESA